MNLWQFTSDRHLVAKCSPHFLSASDDCLHGVSTLIIAYLGIFPPLPKINFPDFIPHSRVNFRLIVFCHSRTESTSRWLSTLLWIKTTAAAPKAFQDSAVCVGAKDRMWRLSRKSGLANTGTLTEHTHMIICSVKNIVICIMQTLLGFFMACRWAGSNRLILMKRLTDNVWWQWI